VPILWEPRGARKGGRLIAFSDGSVNFHEDAEADRILGQE
jgi:hypothetical protein